MLLVYTERGDCMSKKKKIILTVVCIVLVILVVVGATIWYQMSLLPDVWGPGDFPMPDNSIRIVCGRMIACHT